MSREAALADSVRVAAPVLPAVVVHGRIVHGRGRIFEASVVDPETQNKRFTFWGHEKWAKGNPKDQTRSGQVRSKWGRSWRRMDALRSLWARRLS